MSSDLYTISSLLLPYVDSDKSASKIRYQMRLVCRSWNQAVVDDMNRMTRLDVISNPFLPIGKEKFEKIQDNFSRLVGDWMTNIRELVLKENSAAFGSSFRSIRRFWENLRPLANQLTKFHMEKIGLSDTKHFFRTFLSECTNLEDFSWHQTGDVFEFDENDDHDSAVEAFSKLRKLKYLTLHANTYSGHGRFLTSFVNASQNLEKIDIWLMFYRHQDILSNNFAQLISSCVNNLRVFNTPRCLSREILQALLPIDQASKLTELILYLDSTSFNFAEDGGALESAFQDFVSLENLCVEVWHNVHGVAVDKQILLTILRSVPVGNLKKLCIRGPKLNNNEPSDNSYVDDVGRALGRLAPSIVELKINDGVIGVGNDLSRSWATFCWPYFRNLEILHLVSHWTTNLNFLMHLTSLKKLIVQDNNFLNNDDENPTFMSVNYLPNSLEILKLICEWTRARMDEDQIFKVISRDCLNLKQLYLKTDFYWPIPDENDPSCHHIDPSLWKHLFESLPYLKKVFLDNPRRGNSMKSEYDWLKKKYPRFKFAYGPFDID